MVDGGASFRFYDCVVESAKITLNPKEIPMLECSIRCGGWINDSASSGALAAYSLADRPQIPAIVGGSSNTRIVQNGNAVAYTSAEIELTSTVSPVLSHHAAEGVAAFLSSERNCSLSLSTLPTDLSAIGFGQAGTSPGYIQIDAGNIPGKGLSVLIANGQLTTHHELSDADGLLAVGLTVGADVYTSDATGAAGGPSNTPYRVAFI